MSKKISISRKPTASKTETKSADDWVSARTAPSPKPVVMKRLTIDVPATLHAQIKMQCARDGVKMADVIREMLNKRFGDAE